MSFNENLRNEMKNLRKVKGFTYEITNISPAMCSSVSNLVPNQCLDIIPFLLMSAMNNLT